ncbi:SubName: Full=Uncharacterized protein {ECO:0000313/EMBL:CCA77651.1} [Serendipita indica DSM 11827]|nr:SubName: Full=Uncharacterized protein {ECO:0000313/EMBL:CCA77651.1} [Serendipita indica DSM 11827]
MASEQNSKFFFADINNPQHVAMVTLSRSDTVGDLKNAIQYLCYKDVNPFKIDLFQVDISDEGDLAQKIEEKKKDLGSPLLPSRRLIRYYPSTPPEDAIHILVRCSASPHDELLKRKREDDEGPDAKRRKILESLKIARSLAPSSASPKELFAHYKGKIDVNRPTADPETIPISLLHEVFGKFLDSYQTHQPTAEENRLFNNLQEAMLMEYRNEGDRAYKFKSLFSEEYGIKLEASLVSNTAYTTDGHLQIDGHPLIITEAKDDVTSSKAAAHLQAFAYYLQFIKKRKPEEVGRTPCFLVYYIGTNIGFAGAVVGMKPQFEPLTSNLSFEANHHDRRRLEPLVRALCALQQGVKLLQDVYLPNENSLPPRGFMYPYRDFYTDGQCKVTFEYSRRLNPAKLLFQCVRKEDQMPLCVKFTLKYTKEAHQVCSDQGVAPKLYSVERLPGGWWMVVMEYLSEEEYTMRSSVDVDVVKFKEAIKGVVGFLHRSGFVHGDIRACNIMIRREWDDGIGMRNVKLVDFDWAGKDGEARYPANVNYEQIVRPKDARDGLPITKEHDLEMIETAVTNNEWTGRL